MSLDAASVRARVRTVGTRSSAHQAARRRRAGVINRWIGWVCVPFVLLACLLRWVAEPNGIDTGDGVLLLRLVFTPLVFVHIGLSVYVYGWVPLQRTIRVVHIWLGYLYLVFMLVSQTTFGHPLHGAFTIAMLLCLAVHVGMGVHFARRRRAVTAAAHG